MKTYPFLNDWIDDLIWCPSQCYLYFEFNNENYAIYLRWRWDDPWTATLIKIDLGQEIEDGEWTELDIDFFKDTQLDEVKKASKQATLKYLKNG